MEEVAVTSIATIPAPTSTPAVADIVDNTSSEGLGILQRGLFLVVLLACVGFYIRKRKSLSRYGEKGLA